MKRKKLLILYNTSHYVVLFRSNLISELISSGYDVSVMAPKDEYSCQITNLGCTFVDVTVPNRMSLLGDAFYLLKLFFLILKIKPDFIASFTIKPNVYGGIVARILRINIIQNIAGLGSMFITGGLSAKVAALLYKISMGTKTTVFFQNSEDKNEFFQWGIVNDNSDIDILPGSGVDLKKYRFKKRELGSSGVIRLLYVGRLLKEKGICELIEAIKIVNKHDLGLKFEIAGSISSSNPSSISVNELEDLKNLPNVRYHGYVEDITSLYEVCDCIVLPSYREGTSRALLEAAASGLPIIATDVPGCNNIVRNGYNGFLVNSKNAVELADAIISFSKISTERYRHMCNCSRKIVETDFSEIKVINAYKNKLLNWEQ